MVKDAEAHAEEDRKFRELVESRNKADALIHSTEKALKDLGEKVPPADRANDRIGDVGSEARRRRRRQGRDRDEGAGAGAGRRRRSRSRPMRRRARRRARGRRRSRAARAGRRGGKDDVLDAEFEEVKDKKKGA